MDESTGASALLRAVEEEDLASTEKLLLLGADPNLAAFDGSTPQYVACKKGNTELVRALSFCGADPHAEVNAMGETPLHVACHRGHAECVDELCLSGADPNRRQRDGSSPLHSAAKANRLEVAKVLLGTGADVDAQTKKGSTALQRAAALGHSALVEVLLAGGADVHIEDTGGGTALHAAAAAGKAECVARLVAADADVDTADYAGATPLERAVGGLRFGAVKALCAAKADANRTNGAKWTPLTLALHLQRERLAANDADGAQAASAVAALMIDSKAAALDAPNRAGCTPLVLAAQRGRTRHVRWLLRHGASPNARGLDGVTPLQSACQQGRVVCASALLAHGACPRGGTAMAAAAADGRDEFDPPAAGCPPLHLAVGLLRSGGEARQASALALVERLLAAKADPNEKDASGVTPLLLLIGSVASTSVRGTANSMAATSIGAEFMSSDVGDGGDEATNDKDKVAAAAEEEEEEEADEEEEEGGAERCRSPGKGRAPRRRQLRMERRQRRRRRRRRRRWR